MDIARPDPLISGSVFLTPETRAMQADPFDNPSFLWVDLGERLFNQSEAGAPACSICHAPGGLTDTTATYPKIDHVSGELFNLEGRINACRTRHQGLDALDYESEPLLALTAYVARLSQGAPIAVSIEGAAAGHLARGREYFFTRRGQFNLACANCHDENWGKRLRGDTISQGHGNGFPAYRLEWQSFGSLHRRLSDCDAGVRAEPAPLGSQTYIDLELYLAARAEGLEMESPGVRR